MTFERKALCFGDVVEFVSDRVDASHTNMATYISTENMRPNFGGIDPASSIPSSGGVTKFLKNDVLFSNIRTYFKKVWKAQFDGCCSNDVLVLRSKDHSQLFTDYMYNICRWKKFTDFTVRTSKGAKMPRGDKEALRKFEFDVPPLPEQRRIASILGNLDDQIENNRKMAKTLEAMAQAIFQSWFVDFDPVRAKMAGESRESICKRLKITPEILDLFPDRLVDSELGEIPEGWEVKPLGDLLELAYGKPLKAENRTQGHAPVYGSNGIIGWHDKKLVNGPGIVVGRKGNPGTVTWVESNFYPIDTTYYVIPASGIRLRFLYHALMRHDFASLGADSAVPGLNRNLAYISKQLVPRANLCTVFENITEKLILPSHNINKQSRVGTEIRDTLLPKLISGEIRILEAQHLVQATMERTP